MLARAAPPAALQPVRRRDSRSACRRRDENACIAGTMGSRADPIADVDVILTKPDGSTETQTTEDDGRFSFSVTEPGNYLVGVDPDTLPKGSELRPPAKPALAVPTARSRSTTSSSGRATAPTLTVRAADFDDVDQQVGRVPPVQRQRHPARPAAGPGQRRPQPDLRHDRALELRARRAGDPGRHARLRPGQRGRAEPVARRRPGRDHLCASPAGSRTASCGNRCDDEGWA